MPTYSIKAPDGKTYSIPGPDGATDEQVRAEVIRQNPHLAESSASVDSMDAFKSKPGQGMSHTTSSSQGGPTGFTGLVSKPTGMSIDVPLPAGGPGQYHKVTITTPEMPPELVNTAAAIGKTVEDRVLGTQQTLALAGYGNKDKLKQEQIDRARGGKRTVEVIPSVPVEGVPFRDQTPKEEFIPGRDEGLNKDYGGTQALTDALLSMYPQNAALRGVGAWKVGADAAAKIPKAAIRANAGMGAADALTHPRVDDSLSTAAIIAALGGAANVAGDVVGRVGSHIAAPRAYRGAISPVEREGMKAMADGGFAPRPVGAGVPEMDKLRAETAGRFAGGREADLADDKTFTKIITGRTGHPTETLTPRVLGEIDANVENKARNFRKLGEIDAPQIPEELQAVMQDILKVNQATNQKTGPAKVKAAKDALTTTLDNTPVKGPSIRDTITSAARDLEKTAGHVDLEPGLTRPKGEFPIEGTINEAAQDSGLSAAKSMPPWMQTSVTGEAPKVNANLLMDLRAHASDIAYNGATPETRAAARSLQGVIENSIEDALRKKGMDAAKAQGIGHTGIIEAVGEREARAFKEWKLEHGAMQELKRATNPKTGGLTPHGTVDPERFMRGLSDDRAFYAPRPDDEAIMAFARRRGIKVPMKEGLDAAQATATGMQSYNPLMYAA